jgi:hypothetical protein
MAEERSPLGQTVVSGRAIPNELPTFQELLRALLQHLRGATPAGSLLLVGVAGVNLRRFPRLAVFGEGTGKIRSMPLKSEAGLGVTGLW